MSHDSEERRRLHLRMWARSAANLVVGEAAASVLRLVAMVWVARRLGPAGFGIVSLGVVIGGYLVVLAHSGLEVIGTRELAREPGRARDHVGEIVALRLGLGIVGYAIVLGVVAVLPVDRTEALVVLGFAVSMVTLAVDVRWAFIGAQRTRAVAVATAGSALAYLAGCLLVVRTPRDVTRVALVNIAAEVLLVTILVVASRRRFGPWRPHVVRATVRPLLHAAIPLTLMRAARTVMLTVDIVLVQLLRTSRELGYYAAASRVVGVGIVYLGLYYNAFLPTVVHARAEGRGALTGVVHAATRRALLLGVPIAALATVIAPVSVRLVFGTSYEPAIGLVQVMLWALPLLAVTGVYSQVLVAGHAQRALAGAVAAAMTVNLVANLILLPTVGTVGASIATVLGEAVSLALVWPLARRAIRETPAASAREHA